MPTTLNQVALSGTLLAPSEGNLEREYFHLEVTDPKGRSFPMPCQVSHGVLVLSGMLTPLAQGTALSLTGRLAGKGSDAYIIVETLTAH